jgi:hypothetical protein
MAKTSKKAPETNDQPEKIDKSRAASFRRIAQEFSETSVWDNHTIASFFRAEADLLDPPAAEEVVESGEVPEG